MSKRKSSKTRDWVKFDQRSNAYRKVERRRTDDQEAEREIQEAKDSLSTPYNFRFN